MASAQASADPRAMEIADTTTRTVDGGFSIEWRYLNSKALRVPCANELIKATSIARPSGGPPTRLGIWIFRVTHVGNHQLQSCPPMPAAVKQAVGCYTIVSCRCT